MRKPLALCLCIAACAWGAVPTPKEHLGFTPGDDHKLAASSDRLRLVEFGKSSGGKPMLVAFISTPENLRRLDHHRQVTVRSSIAGSGNMHLPSPWVHLTSTVPVSLTTQALSCERRQTKSQTRTGGPGRRSAAAAPG